MNMYQEEQVFSGLFILDFNGSYSSLPLLFEFTMILRCMLHQSPIDLLHCQWLNRSCGIHIRSKNDGKKSAAIILVKQL